MPLINIHSYNICTTFLALYYSDTFTHDIYCVGVFFYAQKNIKNFQKILEKVLTLYYYIDIISL